MVAATIFLVAATGLAQESAGPPATPQPNILDTVLRIAGPVTEFRPITQGERFRQYLFNATGAMPLLGEAVAAGIGQWANRPGEWGQGWDAFGRRYASSLGYNGVRATIAYGISVPLREDTRYFASHRKGGWRRTRYALMSTFTARHPDGGRTISLSSVTGVVGAAAISSIWGPSSWKGTGNIATNAGISFGTTAGLNVLREFLPDLFRRGGK